MITGDEPCSTPRMKERAYINGVPAEAKKSYPFTSLYKRFPGPKGTIIRFIFRSQNHQRVRLFDTVRLFGFCWYVRSLEELASDSRQVLSNMTFWMVTIPFSWAELVFKWTAKSCFRRNRVSNWLDQRWLSWFSKNFRRQMPTPGLKRSYPPAISRYSRENVIVFWLHEKGFIDLEKYLHRNKRFLPYRSTSTRWSYTISCSCISRSTLFFTPAFSFFSHGLLA